MPGVYYSAKYAFPRESKGANSNSSDRINRLRQKTLSYSMASKWKPKQNNKGEQAYRNMYKNGILEKVVLGNINSNSKSNGAVFNGPVFLGDTGCLAAVGGFDINSYSMMYDVIKGQKACNSTCIETLQGNDVLGYINYQGLCIPKEANNYFDNALFNSKCTKPYAQWEIWESSFLKINLNTNCIIEDGINRDLKINNSNQLSNTLVSPISETQNEFDNMWIFNERNTLGPSLNYITWPIPSSQNSLFKSIGQGINKSFFVDKLNLLCPPCSYQAAGSPSLSCYITNYGGFNEANACTYDFSNIVNKDSLKNIYIPSKQSFIPNPNLKIGSPLYKLLFNNKENLNSKLLNDNSSCVKLNSNQIINCT